VKWTLQSRIKQGKIIDSEIYMASYIYFYVNLVLDCTRILAINFRKTMLLVLAEVETILYNIEVTKQRVSWLVSKVRTHAKILKVHRGKDVFTKARSKRI
jgi:hypothetical protein